MSSAAGVHRANHMNQNPAETSVLLLLFSPRKAGGRADGVHFRNDRKRGIKVRPLHDNAPLIQEHVAEQSRRETENRRAAVYFRVRSRVIRVRCLGSSPRCTSSVNRNNT